MNLLEKDKYVHINFECNDDWNGFDYHCHKCYLLLLLDKKNLDLHFSKVFVQERASLKQSYTKKQIKNIITYCAFFRD